MVNPFGQRDLVREIRWTPEEARRTRDGIDLDTLDLAPAARADMQMLREPGAHPLRRQRGTRALETRTRDAIMAAPAIGLVFAATDDVPGRLAAGRAIQRAWLTAAKLGLAIQPHTSSLYLFARASGGDDAPFGAQERAELGQLKARFDAVVVHRPLPVFMFRVFSGNKPPVRSLRRPVASFLLG
jgi:hypothetical protein